MSAWRPFIRDLVTRRAEGSAVEAAPEPKVKGVAFRSVLASLQQLRGEAFVETMLRRMPGDQAQMLRYTVVQTGWYPIALYRALWAAILSSAPDEYDFARAIGGAAIRRDVGGVYRILFKVLSIETVNKLGSKLFSQYYDTGRLSTELVSEYSIRSIYDGCVGFDRAMWEELAGASNELITMAGGRDVRVTVVLGGQGLSSMCIMQIAWR